MENQENKEVSLTKQQEVGISKLDNINDTSELYNLAKVLCESKLLPATYKTPEAALLCIAQGRELGLGAVTSLYNMYFISGKPSLSIHAINGLLVSKGIAFKTIKDYVKEDINPDDPTDFDRVTEIMFYRRNDKLGILIEELVRFTMKDAIKAELTNKDNWMKYPKIMLWNRTFVFGARRIAADVLTGIMEISEAGDTFNKKYSLDEEGNATLID